MEARRAEYEKGRSLLMQKQRMQFVPVPDFKTLHAQQEAEINHRKENIHPTVTLPLELHTNERAKEREKFDRMIKEKERELERVMEQRRREREENEEREVRELRKKAVPKAHEVPEWYNEMPKRKRV
jgi:Targeting protein for Xklp2 (TPX2) domain